MNKRNFVINDHVIYEDQCNMNCDYCLAQDSTMKESHVFSRKEDGTLYNNRARRSYREENVKKEMDMILYELEAYTDIPILKVSGGEVLLIDGFDEYLKKHASRYERVQLLTNGTLLTESFIASISAIPNVQIQLSLDSHNDYGNSYRIKNKNLHGHVLNNLKLLADYDVTVEISSVLTDRSMETLYDFASYLMSYENTLLLNPYPIRGNLADTYFPHQFNSLQRLINEYQSFEKILPPLPYLEQLLAFLKKRNKEFRCCVSNFLLGSFQDGYISTCPLGWKALGNLYQEEAQYLFKAVGREGLCKVLTAEKPIIKYCKNCFSTYDIFSLYVRGDVSLEEVGHIPLFNHPVILARIEEIKTNLI